MSQDPIFIVVPIYNEVSIISQVIEGIKKASFTNIIVVDDGSTDDPSDAIKKTGAIYIMHTLNRGKGAAVKTGIEAAKSLGATIIVTIDGDGQHNPADIKRLIQPIQEADCEVVLGVRTHNRAQMPLLKRLANTFADIFIHMLSGLKVNDSQSGFRAYGKHALELINTRSDRYEFDSEIVREIARHQLRYKEVPIETHYTDYSRGKLQKQGFKNGLITFYKLLWHVLG